ncbi:50s ribosomal protein l10 [Nannochloropsis oceanica]
MKPVCLLSLLVAGAAAFHMPLSSRQPHTKLNAGSAYVSTRTGKEERLEQYKGWLEGAEMIFAIPAQGMTVKQVAQLRKAVPQDTKVRVAKNTILKRAIEGNSQWEVVGDKLESSNMWFFVGSDMKGTFDGYEAFLKENKALKESHTFRFGAMDGTLLDTEGVQKISKLPGKLDLYTKLAFALKQPGTRLGKSLKAIPTKLTRAIKLSFEEGAGEGEAPAAEPAAE